VEKWRALTGRSDGPRLALVEVRFRPETESRLHELASRSGRAASDLIEDAMASYLQELGQVRAMLDSRYEDLKSGRVKAVDGETAFGGLRRKSETRRARRSSDLMLVPERSLIQLE
jgi:predicted DNA-binding protein